MSLPLIVLILIIVHQLRNGYNKKYFDDSEKNWMNHENVE